MTLQDAIHVIRYRWLTVVVLAIVGLTLGAAVFMLRPAQYSASTDLFVSAQVGDSPQQAYQGAQLSEQRVKSYSELVTSDRTLSVTAERLGLTESTEALAQRVAATSAPDSVIIQVQAVDPTPEGATALSNMAAEVTSEVVDELERPTSPVGVAPVAVRVVQPAEIPDKPSSNGLVSTLIVGLASGIVLGVGIAFLRNSLDTVVSSVSRLQESTSVPNLGVVPFDRDVDQQPLAFSGDLHSPRAESIRHIRTNLQFIDPDSPRRVIAVTSSVPSEGKTTFTANLAEAMSSAGLKVLLVEGDLRRPRLSALLGLDRSVGLTSVLSGRVNSNQALQPWNGGVVDVLASGPIPPNPSELLSSRQMDRFLSDVKEIYDIVLIDTPPLLPVTDAAALAPKTDGVLFVCRSHSTSVPQVKQACAALRQVGVEPIGTILTMSQTAGQAYSYSYRADDTRSTSESDTNRPVSRMPAPVSGPDLTQAPTVKYLIGDESRRPGPNPGTPPTGERRS